jgi:hypothetical protein
MPLNVSLIVFLFDLLVDACMRLFHCNPKDVVAAGNSKVISFDNALLTTCKCTDTRYNYVRSKGIETIDDIPNLQSMFVVVQLNTCCRFDCSRVY